MKTILKITWILLIVSSFLSCKKKEEPNATTTKENSGVTFNFSNLTADSYTIKIGGNTQLHAVATGNNLTYNWSATAGDILGSGADVTYGASTCCGGTNEITCEVSDGAQTATKKVTIVVQ
jgi:hypothetical protein